MTLCGKPALKTFALILTVSDWEFEEIFLAFCNHYLHSSWIEMALSKTNELDS